MRLVAMFAAFVMFPVLAAVHRRADVMVTDAPETRLQQKLNPELCSIHLDEPFEFGEKAYPLPRSDVVFQQYIDQWLHPTRAKGELQAVIDKWK